MKENMTIKSTECQRTDDAILIYRSTDVLVMLTNLIYPERVICCFKANLLQFKLALLLKIG